MVGGLGMHGIFPTIGDQYCKYVITQVTVGGGGGGGGGGVRHDSKSRTRQPRFLES